MLSEAKHRENVQNCVNSSDINNTEADNNVYHGHYVDGLTVLGKVVALFSL
jgi:hypothetical protein